MKVLVLLFLLLNFPVFADEFVCKDPTVNYELTTISNKMVNAYNKSFGFSYEPVECVRLFYFDDYSYLGYYEDNKTILINEAFFFKNLDNLNTLAHEVAHHLGYDHVDPAFPFIVKWLMDSVMNDLNKDWDLNSILVFYNIFINQPHVTVYPFF